VVKKGFLQALGVTIYCSFVGLLMWKGNSLFGPVPNLIGPVAFLILFIVSALVCVALVFYQPYQLFIGNKKKQAVDLVMLTTAWLFSFLVVFLSLALFIH
jgi:hypothetical protein